MSYNLLLKFKNWNFRKVNGYPSTDEIKVLIKKTPLKNLVVLGYAMTYCETKSLEETALIHDITTERLRQCLIKIYNSCNT